ILRGLGPAAAGPDDWMLPLRSLEPQFCRDLVDTPTRADRSWHPRWSLALPEVSCFGRFSRSDNSAPVSRALRVDGCGPQTERRGKSCSGSKAVSQDSSLV